MNAEEDVELEARERAKLCCKNHWRGWVIFLAPVILSPICFIKPAPPYRLLFCILVMAVYWITECIPPAATALMPIAFFPLFGIIDNKPVCTAYLKDSVMWFFGSYIISLALIHSKLASRISFWLLSLTKPSPRMILLVFMLFTTLVSMWVPNAGAAAISMAILKSLIDEMTTQAVVKMDAEEDPVFDHPPPFPSKVTVGLYMGVAYAAVIGGASTIIGTDTNIMFMGLFESTFPKSTDMNFFKFLALTIGPLIINFICIYFWILFMYMGAFRPNSPEGQELIASKEKYDGFKTAIETKRTENGRMSTHELQVLVLFIIWILAVVTRKPIFIKGWADALNKKQILFSVAAFFIVALLFIIPVNYKFLKYCICRKPDKEAGQPSLMLWRIVHNQIPWGMFLVVGSCFAICDSIQSSGMSVQIYNFYAKFGDFPTIIVQMLCIIFAMLFTSVTANSGIAAVLIPTIAQLSQTVDVHPLYFMIPTTLALSMGFHLPASSVPNAVAVGYGNLRTKHMLMAGVGPTIITIFTTFLSAQLGHLIIPDYTSFLKFVEDDV